MKKSNLIKGLVILGCLLIAFFVYEKKKANESQLPEYCTVKGNIKGLKDGTKLVLQDAWNNFEVIDKSVVADGKYEFHPRISEPTHTYLYTIDGMQLKDFILEPGTIVADVDADDEEDLELWATGTPSNDLGRKRSELETSGNKAAADSLMYEVLNAEQTGPLALLFAANVCNSSVKALSALDRLSPDLAKRPFVAKLREELTRRVKTEPRMEGSDAIPLFIDMTYPDVNGKAVSLSSVVRNPNNRYVLIDFWATWCSPCVASIPLLKELYAKYHAKGFEIYSVSEDGDEENWKSFVSKNQMTWVNVKDDKPGRRESRAWYDYALSGIPTFVLVDCKSGEIIARDNKDELDAFLGELFNRTIGWCPNN